MMTLTLRICKTCGLEAKNEVDLELFVKHEQCKHGRSNECKQCRNKRTLKNKGKIKELRSKHIFISGIELKKCTLCERLLPLNHFSLRNKSWDNLTFRCKKCINQYLSRWRKNNPEKIKAATEKYKQRHPDKYNETQRSSLNRRLTFKGKLIRREEEFRTNTCSSCRRSYPNELKQRTHLHHWSYDEENPLSNTIELCRSCHITLHHSIRRDFDAKTINNYSTL